MQYFFVIWVVKYGTGWAPLIGTQTAIVHFGERCSFWGATNRMAVTAIADLGERHVIRGAANKSAVTAPLL